MRRRSKVDANQPEVVAALRKAGCTVQSLAAVGKGVPDIMVGRAGVTYLLEIKDGAKPPSARKLTPLEASWAAAWTGGPLATVKSVEEALLAVGLKP